MADPQIVEAGIGNDRHFADLAVAEPGSMLAGPFLASERQVVNLIPCFIRRDELADQFQIADRLAYGHA